MGNERWHRSCQSIRTILVLKNKTVQSVQTNLCAISGSYGKGKKSVPVGQHEGLWDTEAQLHSFNWALFNTPPIQTEYEAGWLQSRQSLVLPGNGRNSSLVKLLAFTTPTELTRTLWRWLQVLVFWLWGRAVWLPGCGETDFPHPHSHSSKQMLVNFYQTIQHHVQEDGNCTEGVYRYEC